MSASKDLLLNTLHSQPTQRVPLLGGWMLGDNQHQELTGCRADEYWQDPLRYMIEAHRVLGIDGMIMAPVPTGPGEYRGGLSKEDFESYKDRYASPEDVLAFALSQPSPMEALAAFDSQAWRREFESDILMMRRSMGNMEYLPTLWEVVHPRFEWYPEFGYENYLMFMQLYPEAAGKLFESEVEVCRRKAEIVVEVYQTLDVVPVTLIGTDICGSTGPLISPQFLEEFYFPQVRRGIEPLRNAGIRTVWHSDGMIEPIVDIILGAGVSGFQGFQVEYGVNIGRIAEHRTLEGDRLTIFAGPSTATTLPFGTVEDVKLAVERIIDTLLGQCALFILPANDILPDCPTENVIAMYEHATAYSRAVAAARAERRESLSADD